MRWKHGFYILVLSTPKARVGRSNRLGRANEHQNLALLLKCLFVAWIADLSAVSLANFLNFAITWLRCPGRPRRLVTHSMMSSSSLYMGRFPSAQASCHQSEQSIFLSRNCKQRNLPWLRHIPNPFHNLADGSNKKMMLWIVVVLVLVFIVVLSIAKQR